MVKMIETPDGDLHEYADCIVSTGYKFRGELHDDIGDVTEVLRVEFWQMVRETSEDAAAAVAKLEADEIMASEDFNNWTDMLCKDGQMCDDTYAALGALTD